MRGQPSVSRGTSPGHASPSARARANNTGRLASETTVPSSRTTWRHASTMNAFDASNASTSSSRRSRSSPFAIRRAAGVFRTRQAAFDLRRQRRDACVARGALGAGERRARHLRPEAPHRDPRHHQLVDNSRRGREGRGVELGRPYAPPRRCGRSGGGAGPRDTAHTRHSPGRRALRASPGPRRAPSPASPGRVRRARRRPRRPHTSRGPPPLSDRRHARHVAGGLSLERDRRAAPSRCLEAREPARRRAGRPASMRRGDRRP